MSKFTAIVLSGGTGKRMQSDIPKQYLILKDKPVLAHSLLAFEESKVDDIVIVCGAGDEEFIRKEFVQKYGLSKVSAICAGGAERYDSVYNGLKACSDSDYVLIHDGARPYLSVEVIQRNIDEVIKYDAVVTAVQSLDTVKIADDEGFVTSTPDRKNVYLMQTPQTFKYELAFDCYDKYINETKKCASVKATDDAQVVEMFSDIKVKLIEGDYSNIKITVPKDLDR
ncbi:MAG: 2-C-methyl-D-erythritol 4-phosphate cytidylyltransferase [Lachnospiraceae bacterium]|nr:2-C-methyl-D-erythritol 4-phosphate cytidylyltransferase [Lachnospiraceae bacterium]